MPTVPCLAGGSRPPVPPPPPSVRCHPRSRNRSAGAARQHAAARSSSCGSMQALPARCCALQTPSALSSSNADPSAYYMQWVQQRRCNPTALMGTTLRGAELWSMGDDHACSLVSCSNLAWMRGSTMVHWQQRVIAPPRRWTGAQSGWQRGPPPPPPAATHERRA